MGARSGQHPRGQNWLWAFAAASVMVGCSSGKAGEKGPASPIQTVAAPGGGPAHVLAPQRIGGGGGAASGLQQFPAIDLDALSPSQREAFTSIANEEVCPCDCPKSFGACLQSGTACRPAILLAEWLVDQLAQGFPADVLADLVASEIGGFSAPPLKPELDGYSSKGAKKPTYQIVEYADFECGHCKAAAPVVDALVKRHPKKVQAVFKHFPLSFHQMATPAAQAVEAAALQGRFWPMHDAVFATQTSLDDELLKGHARALGLDLAKFNKDRKSQSVAERVKKSRAEGEKIGIEATPTFLVNGRPFNLLRSVEAFELRLRMEDARASATCK